MVTADYRDALAKRSTYAWILVLGIAMVAVFSVAFGWPIALGGVAAILGLAGFLDLMGRDAAKFDSAILFAAKCRYDTLEGMDRDSREKYMRSVDRFGVPHVNGVFGPALTAVISGSLGLLAFLAGKYAPRIPSGEAEPLTILSIVTILLAAVSMILLLLSWLFPGFEIWLTGLVDRGVARFASLVKSAVGKVKSAVLERRNRRTD